MTGKRTLISTVKPQPIDTMPRTLLRNSSLVTRSFLLSRLIQFPNRVANRAQLSFFSSDSQSTKAPKGNDSSEDEDLSNQELKKRIDKFLEEEDDDEAIPSLFEAILRRKMSGGHDESDDELMEEIRKKQPIHDVIEDDGDESESD